MANKRDLKRTINNVCSDLFAECVAASLYNGKPAQEDVDAIISTVLVTHNDYIGRVSHPEPGMKPTLYYKHLILAFNKQVNDIVEQIANLA